MTWTPDTLLAVFVVFCRIGTCMMLMPGLSSPRIMPRIRLFIALGTTLALSPMLVAEILPALSSASPSQSLVLIAAETFTGVLIGLLGRLFYAALETMGVAASMAIGISSNLGAPISEEEPLSALASFLTLCAAMMMFAAGLHWEVLGALISSYQHLPVTGSFGIRPALAQFLDVLARSFLIALQLCSPFLIFGLVTNLAFGLLNKLVPQVPVYFVSVPFAVAGGLLLFLFTFRAILSNFTFYFADWLTKG